MSGHHYEARQDDQARERLWAFEDFTAAEEHPGFDVTGSFVSLGFLRAALRRTARAWCLAGITGLILGAVVFAAEPPAYTASASVMVTNSADEDPLSAITTDQTLAESHAVAAAVVRQLGLKESASQFAGEYTVAVVTNQVLQINASGTSPGDSVKRAQAIAAEFLQFRGNLLRAQQALQARVLNQTVSTAQQKLDGLNSQLYSLGSQGITTGMKVDQLKKQDSAQSDQVQSLKQTVRAEISQAQVSTATQVNNSQLLNPAAALPHSQLKFLFYYMVTGLFSGLVLSVAIIITTELISDRIRRRDDVADALGVPVRLSTGPLKRGRFAFTAGPQVRSQRRRSLSRLSGHLRQTLATVEGRPSALVIVAVDNASHIAPAVLALTDSCAQAGRRVLVADLVPGAPVAKLFGKSEPGAEPVAFGGSQFHAYVPDPQEVVSSGPFRSAASAVVPPPDESLMAASRASDLILTVTDLDPATGADHLVTWGSNAVAVVTAGLTHAARLYAAGEMLRLAKVKLMSAVLTDSDAGDESVGVPVEPPVAVVPDASQNGARPPVASG